MAAVLFLWLPYTGILLFAQCLQRSSNYRLVKILVKLKPFFDAYFGPLKDRHRYWVGLLLLVRGILFISYAATPTRDSEVNLLVTLVATLGVLIYLVHVGGVYRNSCLSLSEFFFFLNLSVLAEATLYTRKVQPVLAYISMGIASIQFLVIVSIHLGITLRKTHPVYRLCQVMTRGEPQMVHRAEYEELVNEPMVNSGAQQLVVSYDDYREPVLKYLDT